MINVYLGYGASFGPKQFIESVNALPDKYFNFVSLVHRSVGYVGHADCTTVTDIVKIV